jgi:hypothetical protein
MIGRWPIASHPHASRDKIPLPRYSRAFIPGLSVSATATAAAGGFAWLTLGAILASGTGTNAIPVRASLTNRWSIRENNLVYSPHTAPAKLLVNTPLSARLVAPWAIPVTARHVSLSADLIVLEQAHSAPSGYLKQVDARHVALSSYRNPVSTKHLAPALIGQVNVISSNHRAPSTIESGDYQIVIG